MNFTFGKRVILKTTVSEEKILQKQFAFLIGANKLELPLNR